MGFKGDEHLDNAFREGKGLIVAMSHLGPWEYMGVFSYIKKYNAAIIGRAVRNPYIYNWIAHLRKSMNLDYIVGESTTVDRHPGKLPGASKMHLKLIFAKYSHTLLGAQIYGGDSVGEMVNMFSVMILNKMTDMDIDNLQIGTHPLLTASPVVYPVITATVDAISKWYKNN